MTLLNKITILAASKRIDAGTVFYEFVDISLIPIRDRNDIERLEEYFEFILFIVLKFKYFYTFKAIPRDFYLIELYRYIYIIINI